MTNIVMAVKDRYLLTRQALESLFDNTSDFTLTIVDDESRDFRVRNMLDKYALWPHVLRVRLTGSGGVIARVKNIGVFSSEAVFVRGEWLYLSDCDVCFTKGWLETLTEVAALSEKDDFALWGGQLHPFHHTTLMPPVSGLNECNVLDGPSWLMRHKTWQDIGGMDSGCAPGPCMGEDGAFCEGLKAQGGHIGVVVPHVVYHTGLTQTDGKPAPGADQRRQLIPPGVYCE